MEGEERRRAEARLLAQRAAEERAQRAQALQAKLDALRVAREVTQGASAARAAGQGGGQARSMPGMWSMGAVHTTRLIAALARRSAASGGPSASAAHRSDERSRGIAAAAQHSRLHAVVWPRGRAGGVGLPGGGRCC